MRENKILMIVIAILLPPLAVFIWDGLGKHFVINIILLLLGWILAPVHAIWLMMRDS